MLAPSNKVMENAMTKLGIAPEDYAATAAQVVKFHVVAKRVEGKDVKDGMEIETLQARDGKLTPTPSHRRPPCATMVADA